MKKYEMPYGLTEQVFNKYHSVSTNLVRSLNIQFQRFHEYLTGHTKPFQIWIRITLARKKL